MQPIRTCDIQAELNEVSNAEELMLLLKKYPNRILANLHFSIDGKFYQTGQSIYFDMGEIKVEKY